MFDPTNFNFARSQPVSFMDTSPDYGPGAGGALAPSDMAPMPNFDGLSQPDLPALGQLDPSVSPQFQSMFQRLGLGLNQKTFQGGLDALKSIGGLYLGLKTLGLAKDQLGFMRANANANLANQTQAYNTQIADRARNRAAVEGTGQAYADQYVAQNSLKPRTV